MKNIEKFIKSFHCLFFNYCFNKKTYFLKKKVIFYLKRNLIFFNKFKNIKIKKIKIKKIIKNFNYQIDIILHDLFLDLQSFYKNDPSANDYYEIVFSYPGMYAIMVYRLAHYFYLCNINYLPRILSEYAHSKTGIDIHPGAKISNSFFIDHGTGIVIGETSIIGENVKIYQGVTLGARNLTKGHQLKGQKRHPTIGNNVTIYAGSTILGGDTYIDDNVIVGANKFIIESIKKE